MFSSRQVSACAVVEVMRRQQVMRLRADVGHAEQHVLGELALDGQVVLFGILRFQVRLKLAESKWSGGSSTSPRSHSGRRIVHGQGVCGVCWIMPRKGLGALPPSCEERRIEQRVRKERAAAEGRFRAELLEDELLDGIVEHAEAGANAGFSGTAGELAEPAFA